MIARNRKKIEIVIFCILFLVIPCSLMPQDIKVTRISDDIIILHPRQVHDLTVVREVGGTIAVVRTDSGIIVVDSFVSNQAAEMARKLIREHFPKSPFKYLICTHHHADHVRGNQCFQDACIIGHVNVEKYIMDDYNRLLKKYGHYHKKIDTLKLFLKEGKYKSVNEKKRIEEDLVFWNGTKAFFKTYKPTPPSLQISSNTTLKLGGKTFEILFFGIAHTDNDLVVLDREDRLLIMGDLLCYRKCYIMGSQSNAKNWIALLDQLIDRRDEYNYVIPGHGDAVENIDALVEQRDYLKNICDAVESAQQRHLTLDQAKKSIQLEQYKTYMMYDRLDLDIEAYWKQIEQGGILNEN